MFPLQQLMVTIGLVNSMYREEKTKQKNVVVADEITYDFYKNYKPVNKQFY